MFHSAVGHRSRTTSDAALSGRSRRALLPVSTSTYDEPATKSTLAHAHSFSASETSTSEELESSRNASTEEILAEGAEQEGEAEGEPEVANVKRIVLRKHRSDEVPGTRSLAHQLAASCVDVDNGFWSGRLSTSKGKRNHPNVKGIEQMDPVDKSKPGQDAKEGQNIEYNSLDRERNRGREDKPSLHSPTPSTPLSSMPSLTLLSQERPGREKEKESFPPSAFAPTSYTSTRTRSRSRPRSPAGARPLPIPPRSSSSRSFSSATTTSGPTTPSSHSPTLVPLPPITPSEPLAIDTLFSTSYISSNLASSLSMGFGMEDGTGLQLSLSPFSVNNTGASREKPSQTELLPMNRSAPPSSISSTVYSSVTSAVSRAGTGHSLSLSSVSSSSSPSPSQSASPAPSPLFPLTPPPSANITCPPSNPSLFLKERSKKQNPPISISTSAPFPSSIRENSSSPSPVPQFSPTPPLKLSSSRGYPGHGARPSSATNRAAFSSTATSERAALGPISALPYGVISPKHEHTRPIKDLPSPMLDVSPSKRLSGQQAQWARTGRPNYLHYSPEQPNTPFAPLPWLNSNSNLGLSASAGATDVGGKKQMENAFVGSSRRRTLSHKASLPILDFEKTGFDTFSLSSTNLNLEFDFKPELDVSGTGDDAESNKGHANAIDAISSPEARLRTWLVLPSHSRSSLSSDGSSTVEPDPAFDPERLPGGKRWKGKEKETYPTSPLPHTDAENLRDIDGISEGSFDRAMAMEKEWPFSPATGPSNATNTNYGQGKDTVAQPRTTYRSLPMEPINAKKLRNPGEPLRPSTAPLSPASPSLADSSPPLSIMKPAQATLSPSNARFAHNFFGQPAKPKKQRNLSLHVVNADPSSPSMSPSTPNPINTRYDRAKATAGNSTITTTISALDPSVYEEEKVLPTVPLVPNRNLEVDVNTKAESSRAKEKERRRLPLPPALNISHSNRGFYRLLPHSLPLPLASNIHKREYTMPTNTIVTMYKEQTSNVPFLNIPPPSIPQLPLPHSADRRGKSRKAGRTIVGVKTTMMNEKPPLPPIPPTASLPIYRKHAKRRTSIMSTMTVKSTKSTKSSRSVRSSGGRSNHSGRSGRSGSGRKVKRRSTVNRKKGRRRTGLAKIVVEVKKGGKERIEASVEARELGTDTGTGTIFDRDEVRDILERLRELR